MMTLWWLWRHTIQKTQWCVTRITGQYTASTNDNHHEHEHRTRDCYAIKPSTYYLLHARIVNFSSLYSTQVSHTTLFTKAWNNAWSCVLEINFGVRQGSVLSPFLFAVYLDDFSRVVGKWLPHYFVCRWHITFVAICNSFATSLAQMWSRTCMARHVN